MLGSPDSTFYFENQPNILDQILVNKNLAKATAAIRADPAAVHIVRFPRMTANGRYKSPSRSKDSATPPPTLLASPITSPSLTQCPSAEVPGVSGKRLWLTFGGARSMRAGCGAEVAENWPGHTFVA